MKLYAINSVGEERIKQFLLENHKQSAEQTTKQALSRWVADAIDMAEINDDQLIIAIAANDCVLDQDVALVLDEDCYEVAVMLD